jgi:hypothetical protein
MLETYFFSLEVDKTLLKDVLLITPRTDTDFTIFIGLYISEKIPLSFMRHPAHLISRVTMRTNSGLLLKAITATVQINALKFSSNCGFYNIVISSCCPLTYQIMFRPRSADDRSIYLVIKYYGDDRPIYLDLKCSTDDMTIYPVIKCSADNTSKYLVIKIK